MIRAIIALIGVVGALSILFGIKSALVSNDTGVDSLLIGVLLLVIFMVLQIFLK
ncbi:hypothetical protein ACPB8Q_06050 [Methanocaldococcus indicus]|uniref:hypothetical protein n=1 Tax=Methanocaldococcus indicus TaxID=213231 RepID=UPI003C6D9FD3